MYTVYGFIPMMLDAISVTDAREFTVTDTAYLDAIGCWIFIEFQLQKKYWMELNMNGSNDTCTIVAFWPRWSRLQVCNIWLALLRMNDFIFVCFFCHFLLSVFSTLASFTRWNDDKTRTLTVIFYFNIDLQFCSPVQRLRRLFKSFFPFHNDISLWNFYIGFYMFVHFSPTLTSIHAFIALPIPIIAQYGLLFFFFFRK